MKKGNHIVFAFLAVGFLATPVLYAKPAPKDKKDAKANPLDSTADLADPVKNKPVGWSPEIAALGTLALPIGDAGTVLDMGFGGKADITTHIPALKFLKQKSFDLRPGFFGGYQMNPVKASAGGNFTAMPFVLYAELDFTTVSSMFFPYVAVGTGVTMAAASGTGVSSVDATVYAAGGGKIYLGSEKRIFIKAEAAFFMAFEEVSAMFIQGNIGVGYKI